MFDINYFSRDPRPFYKFAREIYPGQFEPSPCHRFIKMLDQQRKLLRNYSQNIDTLEQVAGIENVIECHGKYFFMIRKYLTNSSKTYFLSISIFNYQLSISIFVL